MQTFGIIMAGGGGTRFWPLSRAKTPKQLLNLDGKDFMINETIDRLMPVVNKNNLYIITNKLQAEKMKEVTSERINSENILIEPSARNTAACIGYAAVEIIKKYGDGIMVITPSDAYIKNNKAFANVLSIAIDSAMQSNKLVTIGITPTFAATGYGYIQFEGNDQRIKPVKRFVEKPDRKTAESYLKGGDYVWNSGMFVWKASVIYDKFKKYLPDIYDDLETIKDALGTSDEYRIINEVYPSIRSISIDYGIMEKSDDILVVPGEFGWNDVGSWDMLSVLHDADENNNISVGDVVAVDTKNSIAYSSGKLISLLGVSDLIVVETDDSIMVCPKNKAQDVKKIVDLLKDKGRNDLL